MFSRIKTPRRKRQAQDAAAATANNTAETPSSQTTSNNQDRDRNYHNYGMEQAEAAAAADVGGMNALIGRSGISLDGRSLILPDDISFNDMSTVQNSLILGGQPYLSSPTATPTATSTATPTSPPIATAAITTATSMTPADIERLRHDEISRNEHDHAHFSGADIQYNGTPPTDDDDMDDDDMDDDDMDEENLSYLGRTDEPSLLSMESIDELPVPPPPPIPPTMKSPAYRSSMPSSVLVTPKLKTLDHNYDYEDQDKRNNKGAAAAGTTCCSGCFFTWVAEASPFLKGLIAVSLALFVGALVMVIILTVGGASDGNGFWTNSKSSQSGSLTVNQDGQFSGELSPAIMAILAPSTSPSATPTIQDSMVPTLSLAPSTPEPTKVPSLYPTRTPSTTPTSSPSTTPSLRPTMSQSPSSQPSTSPTIGPTNTPTTATPSATPSTSPTHTPTTAHPTHAPTVSPTHAPITSSPTPQPTLPPPTPPPTTQAPTPPPTLAPTEPPITYFPGKLTVNQNNLLLSEGLQSRIIATTNTKPPGSDTNFHNKPDAGATFANPNGDGGWAYTSNCDDGTNGGVGALYFDNTGQVIDYKRLLSGTHYNSGGGRTPWDTWMTAEESFSGDGFWDVHPFTGTAQLTKLGGNVPAYWDSFTYSSKNVKETYFYFTEDDSEGPIRRYTPPAGFANIEPAMLYRDDGITEYLVLDPDTKTFTWSSSYTAGAASADNYHPNVEGIIHQNGKLFFVAKYNRDLFELNLSKQTYKKKGTDKGDYFLGEPDMIEIYGKNMYFTEQDSSDEGTSGIHVMTGKKIYTMLEVTGYGSDAETTGVAVSPDGLHLYFAVQQAGIVYDITRTDGYRIDGPVAGVEFA